MNCSRCGRIHVGSLCDDIPQETQEHSFPVETRVYTGGVCVQTWTVPEVGEVITIGVDSILNVPESACIWHAQYGFFQITGGDCEAGTLSIINTGYRTNAVPGTTIYAGTVFVFSPPPCCNDDNLPYPYVAADFEAPANSTCLLIQVTSIANLQLSEQVIIGAGEYRIGGIPDGTHIQICNDGAGITPGTMVLAKDGNGSFQYPITPSITPPCSQKSITGALLACAGDTVQVLNGSYPGQIPFLRNASTDDTSFGFLDGGERTCQLLTAQINLVAGTSVYTLEVGSVSGFNPADILQANFLDGIRFSVTSITDATHLLVSAVPTPIANSTIPVGSYLCKILTEEVLQNAITESGSTFLSTCPTWGSTDAGSPNEAQILLTVPNFPGYVSGHVISWVPQFGLDVERADITISVNGLTPQLLGSFGAYAPRPIRRREIRAGPLFRAVYFGGQYWLIDMYGSACDSAQYNSGLGTPPQTDGANTWTGLTTVGISLYSNSSDEVRIELTAQLKLPGATPVDNYLVQVGLYMDGVAFPGKIWQVAFPMVIISPSTPPEYTIQCSWVTTPPAGNHSYQAVFRSGGGKVFICSQASMEVRRFPVN